METFGSSTIIEIYRYMADLAILTPWSIDAVRGASDYYSDAADITKAMSQDAMQTIIIADYTKIGASPQTKFCGDEKIDHLVTDSKALSKLPVRHYKRLLNRLLLLNKDFFEKNGITMY